MQFHAEATLSQLILNCGDPAASVGPLMIPVAAS